jgi:Zn-dependent protease with chaperone function
VLEDQAGQADRDGGQDDQGLDDRGREALLAHEQAHLSARHHLFTTAAHLAAAANPLLPAAATLAIAIAGASALQAARDLHALLELAGAIH